MSASARLLIALVVASLALSSVGRAEDPKARALLLFREASTAYEHGGFAAAAGQFEESDRLVPRAAALYNAALAWEAAGDPARAAADYERAARRPDLPEKQAASARQQLAALSQRLGVLDVVAPADARVAVGGIEGAGPRLHLFVEPGAHDVRITWPNGAVETRTVKVAVGATEVTQFEARPGPSPDPGPAGAKPPAAPETPPASPRPSSHAMRTVGWAALGGSAVLAGAAVTLGLATIHARDTFEASQETSASAHDDAVRYRLWTNVAWGVAAFSAALGGAFVIVALTKEPGKRSPAAVLVTGPGSLAARGWF